MILCVIKKCSIPIIVILYILVFNIKSLKREMHISESEDEENQGNSCYPDASSLSQTKLFANNSPSNSVESNTSKKNISRSNSEIDEVQEFVSNKKLKVTRDTSSETPRRLSYGSTPNNNNCENESDQGIIIYVFVTVK